ncbi:hypothetical protein [Heyndrickxia acidiproducens]|uniref:hypothetical protein n=1 Tax=Heyndrickxia acidiproducens TaxID=1121084 RepID=UPI0003765830|nr:hypothetical protein [Heyndrickxia acidiproducens]
MMKILQYFFALIIIAMLTYELIAQKEVFYQYKEISFGAMFLCMGISYFQEKKKILGALITALSLLVLFFAI